MKKRIRVGVFFCDCKKLTAQAVDYGPLAAEIKKHSEVEFAGVAPNLCVPKEGELIAKEIKNHKLDRVIVVGCGNGQVEKNFTNLMEKSGLNKHFFTIVGLREGCNNYLAIKMAIASAVELEEISIINFQVKRTVLILGGGIAGIESALEIADKGFPVLLIEREKDLGGNLAKINTLVGSEKTPTGILKEKLSTINGNQNIEVMRNTRVVDIDGNIGNFTVYLENDGIQFSVKVGSVVLATGFQTIFCPVKYGLGIAENVIGQLKLEKKLLKGKDFSNKSVSFVVGKKSENFSLPFAMALKNSLYLKKKFDTKVNVFYTNIKVAGDSWESLYTKAREMGVNFFKFEEEINIKANNGEIEISYEDPFLNNKIPGVYKVISDYVVLPEELLPSEGAENLADILKLELDDPESFFGSNNVHLLSEYTARDGVYLVGSCQSPCLVSEIYIQAQTVAEEILKKMGSAEEILIEQTQPQVDSSKCVVCLTCYRCCPHNAITIERGNDFHNLYKSTAQMNPLACKRCGICVAECPGKAIQMPNYSERRILAQLEAMEV